jgi:nitrite reductase/ring-hydroxylating ferredoxin subunit
METVSKEDMEAQKPEKPVLLTVPLQELERSKPVLFEVEERRIVLVRLDGNVRAVAARCPHLGGALEEGTTANGQIVCPWHDYAFDLETGACLTVPGTMWEHSISKKRTCSSPPKYKLKVFEVSVRDGIVHVYDATQGKS